VKEVCSLRIRHRLGDCAENDANILPFDSAFFNHVKNPEVKDVCCLKGPGPLNDCAEDVVAECSVFRFDDYGHLLELG
jgi:hypothetical protein